MVKVNQPDYKKDKCYGKSYCPMIQCFNCALREECFRESKEKALKFFDSLKDFSFS